MHHHPVGAQEAEVQHLLLEQKHGGHERDVVEVQDVVDNFVCSTPQVSQKYPSGGVGGGRQERGGTDERPPASPRRWRECRWDSRP